MDSNSVNDVVLSGLDQVLPMEKAQKDILKRVDDIIQDALDANDPSIASNALKSLIGVSRISGLASAKFIYTFKYNWKNFNRIDTFDDYADDEFGYKKVTVKRYFRVWEMLVSGDIPKDYVEKLKLLPIRSLIPIANLKAQGVEISNDNWREFSNAPDVATVNKIVREIKGSPPKKGSLQLELTEDGTIFAWKNDKRYTVGHLNVDDKDEVVQSAIERLIGDGRVLEK
jgi:hypothetical protein